MGYYEVKIEASFNASHAIPLPGGQMEKPHQHQWNVTAAFRSARLSKPMGVVVDFLEIQNALKQILAPLEGCDLKDIDFFADKTTSAERVAEFIAIQLAENISQGELLYSVTVSEAPGCIAGYYPGQD